LNICLASLGHNKRERFYQYWLAFLPL